MSSHWEPLPPGAVEGDEGGGDRHGPRSLRPSLDRVARGLGAPRAAALERVFGGWVEAVGPGVAEHAWPVALVAGTLVVGVDHPAWATQLQYLETQVLERLADVAGEDVASRLEVRVRGSRRPG